jgi:hypothetical protein
VHSDAIDQLIGSYLKQPVRVGWEGGTADTLRGSFDSPSIEFAGLATAWLPLERVVVKAAHASLVPGVPARLEVEGSEVEITLGQAELDKWLSRFELPFRLALGAKGMTLHTEIAGFPIGELEARLEVVGGWFVLSPRRASILGVPGYVSSLFRTYLPVPPLSRDTRLIDVGHRQGELRLSFEVGDLVEDITPGLVARLQRRLLPFGR